MEVWESFLGKKVYNHAQVMKYQDCAMRYTGVYEYAIMCDVDDFFNPVIPNITDVHYYLEKLFESSDQISCVNLLWKRYVCKPVPPSTAYGNLTRILPNYSGEKIVNSYQVYL